MSRCATCRLPVGLSKARRELLQAVADGRWHDIPDADFGKLEALARDGLVWWVECKPPTFEGGFYQITERGDEILNEELNLRSALELAADLLAAEGYDTDPDYVQEWQTISAALEAS